MGRSGRCVAWLGMAGGMRPASMRLSGGGLSVGIYVVAFRVRSIQERGGSTVQGGDQEHVKCVHV